MGLFDFLGGLFGSDSNDESSGSPGAGDDGTAGNDGDAGSEDVAVTGASDDGPATGEIADDGEHEASEIADDDGDPGAGDPEEGTAGDGSDDPPAAIRNAGDGDQVPPGAVVADTPAELREQAEEFAEFWSEYDLDYTPGSIPRLDEMFATQQERANWMSVEYDDGRKGSFAPIAASAAAYFGETMIRSYDVEWAPDEDFGWALQFADGTLINIFGTAHRALGEDSDPPFVTGHDTFVERFDLDGERIDADGDTVTVVEVGDEEIDPSELDEEEIERAAEEMDLDAMLADFVNDAEEFADSWPRYDLDFSPESLGRLDALVETEFDHERFADAEMGSTADEDSILLTVHAMDAGAYFAEVFRRTTDAEWRHTEEHGLRIELPGTAADARIDPIGIAENVFRGGGTFAGRYQATVEIMDEIESAGGDGSLDGFEPIDDGDE